MAEFTLHPNVYSTGGTTGLRSMLEKAWVRDHTPGDGTLYIVSGFANYNGGARFYRTFREHVDAGGKIVAYLAGSTAQRLSSRQSVEALLQTGAEVHVIDRKRLVHAKVYGVSDSNGDTLVVSSGNFTGPGMSQNVEASFYADPQETSNTGFVWNDLATNMNAQKWLRYQPDLGDLTTPGWKLLYDETPGKVPIDESERVTMIVVLGHADTARIQADKGTNAAKGTQYFWLSKDSFDFFPPLVIRNVRGIKGTLSCLVTLEYVDLGITDNKCRVTFEAENNLDFRLGTGKARCTKIAAAGDIACITRMDEARYQLRIFPAGSHPHGILAPHAVNFIGHQGKRYGYMDNEDFEKVLNKKLQ
jgi:hypothetical protein